MRYKEHTVRKLDSISTKLETLQRQINNANITGENAVRFIQELRKELHDVIERLELEPSE